MAECDRLRHRLAYRSPLAAADDDDEDDDGPKAVDPHLFAGSFQYIVQEQAKSMVAIQELQQEVGSLLLFRQAVLAALPHLQSSSSVAKVQQQQRSGQSWTRRKQQLQQQLTGYRSLQDGSESSSTSNTTGTTTATAHHPTHNGGSAGIVDSGFSTEASNTSPRSSRFDTSTSSSAELTMPHPPMEKELVQHLERVQQRLARLKKDEDRLLTILNPTRRQQTSSSSVASSGTLLMATSQPEEPADELWLLLEEIEWRSQDLRLSGRVKDVVAGQPEDDVVQSSGGGGDASGGVGGSGSHKKRVSFQQQQQQQLEVDATGGVPAPEGRSSRYQPPTRDQVAAILRLTNPVQLQRHLLRALLDNQTLREQVEAGRTDAASREAQWRTRNQSAVEQMTALRDENEDLRFQLEEQKIELEGTKARLRMLSRTPTLLAQPTAKSPALVTSVRVRAASTQTERTPIKMLHQQQQQSTQTECDDHHKLTAASVGGGRALPRVVDASPKPKLSKLADLTTTGRGSGSWAVDEEERPSVERRSYSASRIPTPIKPTSVTPTIPANSTNNNNNHHHHLHVSHKVSSPMTPSKRELPDLPKVSATTNKQHVLLTPQLSRQHPHRNGGGLYVASKSEPAKVRVTVVTAGSSPHQRVRTRLALSDSLSSSEEPQLVRKQVDDYYDSINANQRVKRHHYQQQQQHRGDSPADSLERSFPSVECQEYRRVNREHRYHSQSSAGSSTTPSNSLS